MSIAVKNLTKTFGQQKALQELSDMLEKLEAMKKDYAG